MTEPERIKNIEEHITLAGLLPGVNLGNLPPEESANLKRAVLDLYRISHARGFNAGADHAMNAVASAMMPRRDISQLEWLRTETQWLKRRLLKRSREFLQDSKSQLRSIRTILVRKFMEE